MAAHLRPFARIVRVSLVLFLLGPTFGVSSSMNVSAERQVATNGLSRLGLAMRAGNAEVLDKVHSALLMFIETVGQFDEGARFQMRGAMGGTAWLARDGLWLTILE